jgi:hypothetical protein
VVYGSKSAGGITLISETIVLRRTDARSIKRETTGFSEDVRPHGCHGRLGVFCQKTDWYCGETLPKSPRLLAHRVSSSSKKKRQPARDGEVATCGCHPPLMCTMTELLHYNSAIKRVTNHCFFHYFTYK